jgi:hypothetical protein
MEASLLLTARLSPAARFLFDVGSVAAKRRAGFAALSY